MRRITELWRSRRARQPRSVYVGSYEDRLSRLPAMHIDPDDDGRTGEDVDGQKTRSPHLMPPGGRR
jgi:hypothetical protein